MLISADQLVKIAYSEVGYLEKASNSNLDSKTANAGYANYTKYARDLAAAGYYNGNKNGYSWCFTEGTLILTDRGYKPIEDVGIGDRVLNATGDRFNTVTKIAVHDSEVMFARAYGAVPFTCTPDHPFLSQRRNDKWHRNKGFSDYGFHEISSLRKGDVLAVPKSPTLYETGMSYDDLWTLGYYVGDGYTTNGRYFLCANENKSDEVEIHADVVRGKDYKSRTCIEYKMNLDGHSALKDALLSCGIGAANKRVPPCILFGTAEAKKAFISGYLAADGCAKTNGFNSVSAELVTGLARILFDVGRGCSIVPQERPTQGKIWDSRYNTYRVFNQRPVIYNCRINDTDNSKHQHYVVDGNATFVSLKAIGDERTIDTVYTLTTDGDHTYTANNIGVHNCDVFVDWCFYQLCGGNAAKAQEVECQSGDLGASCTYSAMYYKRAGRFYSRPEKGDQIFFQRRGEVVHTGIVEKVESNRVYTIEGNTSSASGVVSNGGGVFRKSYSLDSTYIYGYGRPKYGGETATNVTTTPAAKAQETAVKSERKGVCEVNLPVLSNGDKSGYVKTLQILLNKYNNAGLVEDGDFGGGTLKAVKNYQKSRSLYVDGIVGSATWKKLLS